MERLAEAGDRYFYNRHKTPKPDLFQAVRVGLAAALLALLWQWATVTYNYKGEWTALFRAAGGGQVTAWVARDPWMRLNPGRDVDSARVAWRRILVPGLAWALALGRAESTRAAVIGLTLGFVALGAAWLALFCAWHGLDASCGLLFLLAPGTLASIDRMTVDVAAAALCAGFALYSMEGQPKAALAAVLAMAGLAHEAGICLALAYLVWALVERKWMEAAVGFWPLLPGLLWMSYVNAHTVDPSKNAALTWGALLRRTLKPELSAEYAALIGLWIALVLLMQLMLKRRTGALELAALGLGAWVILVSRDAQWTLFFSLFLAGIPLRFWAAGLPLALSLPALLLPLASQARRIVEAWTRP